MKNFLKILGLFFWLIGFVGIVYIMREVLSFAEGYRSLVNLIGPFIFHALCMFVGGFFFKKAVQKAPGEPQESPAAG